MAKAPKKMLMTHPTLPGNDPVVVSPAIFDKTWSERGWVAYAPTDDTTEPTPADEKAKAKADASGDTNPKGD